MLQKLEYCQNANVANCKCCRNATIFKTEMLPNRKVCQQTNVAKGQTSPKRKHPQNANIFERKCFQNTNVIKTQMSPKNKCCPNKSYAKCKCCHANVTMSS